MKDTLGVLLAGGAGERLFPLTRDRAKPAVPFAGQYRIIDLRPGTYSLTFTLPGFNTVKRENIELSGTQTLTIAVDMKVGGLEETITVTGETPVVDVQNARRETVIKSEVIQQLPATRAAGALLNITPGINVAESTGGALSPTMTSFNARSSTINSGSVAGEGRYAINGFPVTAARRAPGGTGPRLEYTVTLFTTGTVTIWAYLSPRNSTLGGEEINPDKQLIMTVQDCGSECRAVDTCIG